MDSSFGLTKLPMNASLRRHLICISHLKLFVHETEVKPREKELEIAGEYGKDFEMRVFLLFS